MTHYFNTLNYGGALQAYALPAVLKKMGYPAEQICYQFWQFHALNRNMIYPHGTFNEYPPVGSSVSDYGVPADEALVKRHEKIEKDFMIRRREAFVKFLDAVPHSENIYPANMMFAANDDYDTFIVGSDQVWNMKLYSSAFFLEFADENKKKIAYSASAGSADFDEIQLKYLKRVLPRFDSISVREKDLADACRLIGVPAKHTLDSVLLLEREDWDAIASERLVDEKYLFCFFYDPLHPVYALAKEYAKKHSLKIVTIPYAFANDSIMLDDDFGDIHVGAASPADFISLIKHAECVFTDSFHAAVYSLLYRHQLFAFRREWHQEEFKSDMSSRIYTLFDIFGCTDHFCDRKEKVSIDYIENTPDIDFSHENQTLNRLKEESLEYLQLSLGEVTN